MQSSWKTIASRLPLFQVGTTTDQVRFEFVISALEALPAGYRLLDAGAGEQRFRPNCKHLDYVAQDFAKYDGQGDGCGLQMGSWDQTALDIVCDITAIPEPDSSFDAILCSEVLEHVENPNLVLAELSRLLRPGGTMIVTAPFCSITHFAPYHFSSGFNVYFYRTVFAALGLTIVREQKNGNFYEYVAQEIRRTRFVSRDFSRARLRMYDYIGICLILHMLARLSRGNDRSEDLLYFGLGVVAEKRIA